MWSFFSRDALKDFGYDVSAEIEKQSEYSLWKLHSGKKKVSGEPHSIFVFEATTETQTLMDLAKSAVKRLKTLRHPSILTYVDSFETDKLIYLVVEPIEPLELYLSKNLYSPQQENLALSWGFHQIASGIAFLNKDCQLSHNNICMSSIFVDRAGEWRLFGLEYMASTKEPYPTKVLPALRIYNPPEHETSSQGDHTPWAYDSWGLGCLIWEAFNGKLSKVSSLKNPGKIASNLQSSYCELVCANPKSRPSSTTFLKKASKGNGFFKNKFVDCMLFLREIHIKENDDKIHFFNNLPSCLDDFPQDICLYKVLPELVNAFEYGNAGSSILTPMFKLGKLLPEDEYQKRIVPCIVKMFSFKDRATRAKLLQQVEHFIDHIQPSIINNQIFPSIAQGFQDTNPTIRDQTIKCMMYLSPKLNYQNLNDEMLKHMARLQAKDEQGGIRTNTTVCLGKIASYLHPETRKKVLISAFLRALRDPFPPARAAAILALSATEHYYSINDCATKLLPALCHFTIDPEKSIREQAFKAISGFIVKLEKVSDDPSLKEKMEQELQSTTPVSIAASWTSWAVTSLTDKFIKSSKTSNQPSLESKTEEKIIEDISSKNLVDEDTKRAADSWSNEWVDAEETLEETSEVHHSKEQSDDWNNEWDNDFTETFEEANVQTTKEQRVSNWANEFENENINIKKNTEKLKSLFPGNDDDPFKVQPKESDWNTSADWDSWENSETVKSSNASNTQEANRLAREEKRRQRLKERQLAKPKKLGAQKIS